MNIMITSIGQRGYLVDHFRESLGATGQIFGADSTEYAPALQLVDKAFKIPMADHPAYGDRLLELCLEQEVDGLITINDRELPYLAALRDRFLAHGVVPVVSTPDVVDICFDKYRTYEFCVRHGIPAPLTFQYTEQEALLDAVRRGALTFPLIAKSRKGSGSKGIYLVHHERELLDDIAHVRAAPIDETEKVMYQERSDSEQYSLHIFNDWEGRPVTGIGMCNLFRHMNGETFHIRSLRDPQLIALGEKIGASLGHLGPLCADVHKRGDEFVLLELNPRLGGCYSLSHFAGADFTGKIMRLIAREPITHGRIDDFAA